MAIKFGKPAKAADSNAETKGTGNIRGRKPGKKPSAISKSKTVVKKK